MNNLEYYKVFYYVGKVGSLTAAAKELNISQPAISQSLRQLEEELHTKLFQRVSRGVRLTREGELLFSYVQKGYEQIALGEEKLKKMLNLELGEIKIGASDMTLQFYLLPYLERFHEQYPGIKVNVTNAPTPETIDNLLQEKIDFGIISTPFESHEEIETMEVSEIEDTFVAARRFIGLKNRTLDLHDLESLPMILLEKNTSTRSYMDTFLEQNGVTINPEFELATSDMIVQFALRNLGIGCVMKDFAREYIERGTLFELRLNKMIPKRHFCIAVSKKGMIPEAAKKLLAVIGAETDGGV